MKYHVRWMIRRDMLEVLNVSLENCTGWGEEEFLVCLRQRDRIGIVSEVGERVTGAMIYRLGETLELLYLCADRGGENAMLVRLKSKLNDHRRKSITCDVGEWDLERQILLRSHGFIAMAQVDRFIVFEIHAQEEEVRCSY